MAVIEKRTGKDGSVSYRAKIRLKGFPPQSATFERKTDAKDWAQETEASIKNGRYFPNAQAKKRTLSDLLDLYLKSLKARNPKRYKDVQPLLEWWHKELGHALLADLRSETLFKSQQKLSSRTSRRKDDEGKPKPVSNAYVNRYMVALNTALNFAVRTLQWIPRNPMDMVDNLQEPPGRTRFLNEDEIQRLMTACRESESAILFPVVILAISTGARRGEILKMRWEDVDLKAGRVSLQKTKNKETRAVYLSGVALDVVKNLHKEKQANQVLLFPSKNRKEKPAEIKTAWYTAVKNAKLVDFHFHDLRHTCASYLAMNGASLAELAEVLGHKTLQMVKRYAHLSESHTANVVAKMNEKVLGNVKF